MNITIRSAIFQNPANIVRLDAIATLALDRVHRIFIRDDEEDAFKRYLGGLSADHREMWDLIIENSFLAEAREPARRSILIDDIISSDWGQNPPALTLSDASLFLRRPFHILLEDSVSDRHFLLRMATREQRDAILQKEADGAVFFENGGGISSMLRRVDAVIRDGVASVMRFWVMCDSDALRPGEPSHDSDNLIARCRAGNVLHYRLQKRSIENYLPNEALHGWTFSERRRSERTRRQRIYNGLLALTQEQRDHYNFKDGFNGDSARQGRTARDLFDNVASGSKRALNRGFGTGIASLFQTDVISEQHLRRDGCWNEINPAVTNLIALIR